YDSPFVIDMVRSSMKPGQITGAYTDYGARYRVWSQLIGGLRTPAVWWYGQLFRRGDGKPGVEGLRLKKMFADLRDSGADRVLGEGKRKISPLTLVWSTPSLVASEIEKKNNPVSRAVFTANLDSWSQLICDSGMDMANVIAAEDLAKITPASNPVVILPCTIRLSDEQIKILEQYAAAGGVLIADLYPGKFDSFGVERKENKLYALFGITKMQKRLTGKNTAAGEWALPDILPGNIIGYAADAQSFCQLSTNSGKIPAVIIRKVGKGKTVYLNFAWNLYNKKSSSADDSSRGHRGLLKQIFECAGVNITGNHTLPPGSAFAEYGFGNARYMFVSRRAGKSKGEFALQLGRKMHVYDMFKHKYLGTMSVCKGFLKDNEVKFIGIFPEKLKKFTGTVSFDGRHINVSALRSHPAFSELVRIRVFFNGREIQQLGMTNMLTDTMKVKIDLGREPAKGKWNVLMTSAADGSKVEYSFVVR
ncbi:MAG: hypothetical protein IKA87_03475, partial [Lentisphaeria bacterium]|nr:hypothetical protein [Lentisphaeria bacterium]